MVRSLLEERDNQRQRAEQQQQRAEQHQQRAEQHQQRAAQHQQRVEELRVENLRLQLELERFKKWYYGPRADRLQSLGDLAQLLLTFSEELDRSSCARSPKD